VIRSDPGGMTRQARRPWAIAAAVGALLPLAPACPPRCDVRSTGDVIPDRYIVVLKRSLPAHGAFGPTVPAGPLLPLVNRLLALHPGTLLQTYPSALFGFSVKMDSATAASLACNDLVEFVEQDRKVHAAECDSKIQWGLDRIDQERLPLNDTYTYPKSSGQGVSLYVLDTGVDEVPDLQGRVTCGGNFVSVNGPAVPDACADKSGHGTFVACVAAGVTDGVAKLADVVNVRVLEDVQIGQNSDVIAGLNWVAANARKPAVVNLSLIAFGGGPSDALDRAIRDAVGSGLVVVAAAGNDGRNACGYSPPHVSEAIVVGAATCKDEIWFDSNTGPCLDLFAPGYQIESFWGSNGNVKNGTSFAAPHVAGAAALYLADHVGDAPAKVEAAILAAATKGILTNIDPGSPNRLLRIPPGDTWPASEVGDEDRLALPAQAPSPR
jgi:hypothetical protein